MTVFVDTGVIYAHHDEDAARHEDALAYFEAILEGRFGQPFTSDYILDETITLTRKRTGSFEAADTVARRILGEDPFPTVFELLNVRPDDVREAMDTFRYYDDHPISFTDATSIALCDSRDIDFVASFDDDFDGLVDRLPVET